VLRALLWLGALPLVGGVVANVIAIGVNETTGHEHAVVWLGPPVVIVALVARLVRRLALRRDARRAAALAWGLAAGALTVVASALPAFIVIVTCPSDCWS
jgi:hypothetical protein